MKRIVSSSAHISAKASKSSAEGGRRIRRSVTSKGPLSMAILSSAWRRGDASAARGGARQAHTLEDTGGEPVSSPSACAGWRGLEPARESSEERRVGKGGGSAGRARWWPG